MIFQLIEKERKINIFMIQPFEKTIILFDISHLAIQNHGPITTLQKLSLDSCLLSQKM